MFPIRLEPMLYGEFRLEKPPEVWRNIIYDMVIYGDRAYLKAVVLGTVPDFDFRGIIVVDLSSPDPIPSNYRSWLVMPIPLRVRC